MKVKKPANDNAVERTRLVWERRMEKRPADEDLRELSANIAGFFSVLAEWSRKETPGNDNAESPSIADEPKAR